MLFTDADMSAYSIPDNVHVHAMTLEEIRQRAAKHLDFDPVLTTPYKLCDYKPMYGLIFQDYLAGYDFWGHVDPDVVWGDMGSFITDELLDEYSRLFQRGHLNLYRNTDEVNHFALHELPGWNICYKDIYSTTRHCCYDESALIEHLFSKFTDGGGGFSTIVSFLRTYPQSLGISRVTYTENQNILLHCGGLTANCTDLLLTVILNARKNTCMSICRRGP